MTEKWSSGLTFILAAIGSAVGIGTSGGSLLSWVRTVAVHTLSPI